MLKRTRSCTSDECSEETTENKACTPLLCSGIVLSFAQDFVLFISKLLNTTCYKDTLQIKYLIFVLDNFFREGYVQQCYVCKNGKKNSDCSQIETCKKDEDVSLIFYLNIFKNF